jgi:hypothetical protein
MHFARIIAPTPRLGFEQRNPEFLHKVLARAVNPGGVFNDRRVDGGNRHSAIPFG